MERDNAMYYVAGGYYHIQGTWDSYEFNLVRPHGNEPCYITKNNNGLRLTSHHASLYAVTETEDGYLLKRRQHRCSLNSPSQYLILKNSNLWEYLNNSIKYAETNNWFME